MICSQSFSLAYRQPKGSREFKTSGANREGGTAGRVTDRQRAVIALLYKRGPLTARQIASETGGQALSNTLDSLVKRSILLEELLFREEDASKLMETRVRLVEAAVPDNDTLAAMLASQGRRLRLPGPYRAWLAALDALLVAVVLFQPVTTTLHARSCKNWPRMPW